MMKEQRGVFRKSQLSVLMQKDFSFLIYGFSVPFLKLNTVFFSTRFHSYTC